MYRFVLTGRWLGFALFVIVLAGVCVRLGNWQFDRHAERKDENAIVREHLGGKPVAIDDVVAPDADAVPTESEWTTVTATGTYDTEHQVIEKYQTRDSPGVEIVTPLVTESGTAVLVNRGWMDSPNTTATIENVPPPTDGTVTVTGWIRVDSGAEASAVEPVDGQVRAISSAGIETALPYDAYPGFVNLNQQQPAATGGLDPEPVPDLGQGPHFFYALQWYFFAGLAVFGWFYFAWTEAHPRSRRQGPSDAPPPTDVHEPAADDASTYSVHR
ncbi:MAG: SURF1 family cytochrome oxidase biogenesis protein [Nocardioidaceae bacterium]